MPVNRPSPRSPGYLVAPASERRFSRRAFTVGLAAAGVAGVGSLAYGITRLGDDDGAPKAPAASAPEQTPEGAAAQATDPPGVTPSPTPADEAVDPTRPPSTPAPEQTPRRAASTSRSVVAGAAVPDGMALVTSPRLPLFGVGERDATRLLRGEVADWRDAGSPVGLEVVPVALDGEVPEGMDPAEVYADYDALAAALAERPGGLALVPLDQVDFRVNVLAVDGFDPLRDAGGEEPTLRLAVVGDIVPGRNVHNKMRDYGDFTRPFRDVAAELAGYDLTFANLEGNLSSTIQPPADAHTFSFISDPAMLEGFKLAGIDGVSLANNHSAWNNAGWGVQALLDTMASLSAAGLPYFGAGLTLDEARAPWTPEVKGQRVAILGIDGVTANQEQTLGVVADYVGATADSPGTNPFVTDQFLADIAAAVERHDIVIPYFHLGVEYVAVPPEWAVAATRAAIDAGATMVVTNHPHVIQGMEVYAGKPIVYSPGNFIFDQMFSVEVRTGLILEIVLRGNRVVGLRPKGVEIEDFHRPRLMTADEHAALMDRFWWATDRLAAR